MLKMVCLASLLIAQHLTEHRQATIGWQPLPWLDGSHGWPPALKLLRMELIWTPIYLCNLSWGSANSLLHSLPSRLCPDCPSPGFCRHTWSANIPRLVKLPKSRLTAHLHSFFSLFSLICFPLFFSHRPHSSLSGSNTAVHHDLRYPD